MVSRQQSLAASILKDRAMELHRLCPFCGSDELLPLLNCNEWLDNNSAYYVKCRQCKARGPQCSTPEEAINKWNSERVPS